MTCIESQAIKADSDWQAAKSGGLLPGSHLDTENAFSKYQAMESKCSDCNKTMKAQNFWKHLSICKRTVRVFGLSRSYKIKVSKGIKDRAGLESQGGSESQGALEHHGGLKYEGELDGHRELPSSSHGGSESREGLKDRSEDQDRKNDEWRCKDQERSESQCEPDADSLGTPKIRQKRRSVWSDSDSEEGDENKKFKCDLCLQNGITKAYKNRSGVYMHIQSVHMPAVKCPECAKSFKTKSNLNRHRQILHLGTLKLVGKRRIQVKNESST